MASLNLFPTLLHATRPITRDAGRFHAALVREARLFRKLDREGVDWSKRNYLSGYTSYSSITDLPFRSSNFGRLKTAIDREVAKYARALELDLGRGALEMTSCWVNIMGKGCTHAFHLHPLSVVSGTYFLQVPKGAGALKFEDPRLAAFMASPPRKSRAKPANQRFFSLAPRAGDLILFESWLKHQVEPSRSAEERISVSFNYDWVSR